MDRWDEADEEDGEEDFRVEMGKNLLIFLVDATSSSEGTDLALKCGHSALKNLIWKSSTDLFSLVLFGGASAGEDPVYSGSRVTIPLGPAEPENILLLEHEVDTKFPEGEVSLNDALWRCQSLFSDVIGKIGSKRILLFTDKEDSSPHERKRLLKKAQDLSNNRISVELIPLKSDFNVEIFYSDFLSRCNDELSDENMALTSADDLMKIVRRKIYNKRRLGSVFLDFGNKLKAKVSIFNFVGKTVKKRKVYLTKDANEEVNVSQKYIHPEKGTEINLQMDLNKYQEYGGRRIVFTQDEVKMVTKMGLDSEEIGLKILGFKPLSSLKWSSFVRSGNFVYPEEESISGSKSLVAALLIKCLEKKVMAVCYYKARSSWGPSFVGLIPQEETREDGVQESPPGFHLVYLPFSDDIRNTPSSNIEKSRLSPEQLDVSKRLIQKLRLKNYNPEAFENPELQSHYLLIESLALNRDEVETLEDSTLPPFDIMKKKLGMISTDFTEAVYPDSYDPEEKPTKRKAENSSREVSKKSKMEEVDMDIQITNKTVEKLTVDVLKKFLINEGIAVTNKKKAELVKLVYSRR